MKKPHVASVLGKLLQESRLKKGLLQKDVAEALGYTTAQVVSDWERGIRSPPGTVFRKLVKIYDVPPQVFFDAIYEERAAEVCKEVKKLVGLRD